MNLRGLQTFCQGEGRQDARQALGHHRLATAWRSDEDDIVPASRSNLQGTLHSLLPFHIGKVKVEGTLLFIELLACIDEGGLVLGAAIEETDDIGQTVHTIHVQLVHDRRFTYILLRHNQPFELLLPSPDGDGEHTTDRFQLAVESQLADHHIVAQHRLADLSVGCEDADGQR